ncbi:MAG: hypothetical protein HZA07_02080 [Nitrospirae bacterium]|nr:hypothetical protein [Nitrospirota bacterium]
MASRCKVLMAFRKSLVNPDKMESLTDAALDFPTKIVICLLLSPRIGTSILFESIYEEMTKDNTD